MKLLLTISLLLLTLSDWPQFRGPDGQGHSEESGLPLNWSETKNIKWKVPIPGRGWSSPVVQGKTIWLTTATDEGRSLRALAIDSDSGKIVQDIEVFKQSRPKQANSKNSFASPTPVIDGDHVYVHFGAYGTACIKQSGEIVWKTKLEYDNGQHGTGSSPVIYEDLLIISCDGNDVQYVVALDKLTGKVRWKKSREGYQAYTTPLVIKTASGDQLISPGAFRSTSYEPRTGKELWYVKYGEGFSNVPRPVFSDGLVLICTGFQQPSLLAVQLDGKGDVTKSKLVWKLDRGVPLTPSPLIVGNELYLVTDNGIATCIDVKTGKEYWRARVGGNHSASPVYADGRIYFLSEEGESVVIAPGQQLKHLATNQLDGPTLASMAIANTSIYIRSDTHLYRISN
jgi:outer membrane protein assembly factor BamB